MNMIIIIIFYFIVFVVYLLGVFYINAYPFVFTRNPEEHANKYKEGLCLFAKGKKGKNPYYEFRNTKNPEDNLKVIIVQYNKFFGIYYLSKYFYSSNKLIIYNSGIYRRREEMEKINDA